MTNEYASALGRLARGKSKTITPQERKARAERMKRARESRWKKPSITEKQAPQ